MSSFKKSALAVILGFTALCVLSLPALAQLPPTPTLPGGSLDPTAVQKYVDPVTVPGVMPKTSGPSGIDYYEIALRQFKQQVLPTGFPKTTVWGYGAKSNSASFRWPANTIEATVNKPVRVRWINELKDLSTGKYLPHLFAVDQTLHWANPPMDCADGMAMTDCRGDNPLPYKGPVPMVPHLHGAHVQPDSDGYPEAWFLPAAGNIPAGYAKKGSHFDQYTGLPVRDGEATYQYPNDQRAATLWYHDHVLGITRLSVYAGTAGFYLLRGGSSDLPAGKLPSGAYEVPLVLQDRSFNSDGSLFFPSDRAFFEGLTKSQLQIPFTPSQVKYPNGANLGTSDVSPIWNPEFFGNFITVNGKTWPYMNVEPRRYRLRLVNGANARAFVLTLSQYVPVWQIGADGGFLKVPAKLDQLTLGPAERADLIVDFTGFKRGTKINVLNIGADSPHGAGVSGVDYPPADPASTGQVMQFRVVSLKGCDTSLNPANIVLPTRTPLGPANKTRKLSTNEMMSMNVIVPVNPDGTWQLNSQGNLKLCSDPNLVGAGCDYFGPTMAMLGTLDENGNGVPKMWMDPITENPAYNSTEIWEIHNFTEDAHPIHLHLVQFEVVNRQPFGGAVRPPEPGETGTKDTLLAFPGEITRLKAKFDMKGLFVWHCHIIDHEDNEMMRPYYVGPMPANP